MDSGSQLFSQRSSNGLLHASSSLPRTQTPFSQQHVLPFSQSQPQVCAVHDELYCPSKRHVEHEPKCLALCAASDSVQS